MAEYIINAKTLAEIAKAIRSKTYSQARIKPSAFAAEIETIKVGEIPEGMVKPYGTLYLSREGDFDVTNYARVTTRNMILSTEWLQYLSGVCYGVQLDEHGNDLVTDEIVLAAYEGSMPISSIAQKAFKANDQITGVTIPEGYTLIRSEAFAECAWLAYVQLPRTLTSIEDSVFKDCAWLKSIALPPKLTEISSRTFSGCKRLTDVIIPEGVTAIGEEAFASCTSLPILNLPASLDSIGKNAFSGSAVSRIYYQGSWEGWRTMTLEENWHGNVVTELYYRDSSGRYCYHYLGS